MYINSSRLIRTYSRNRMSSPIYSEERTMNKNKNKNKNKDRSRSRNRDKGKNRSNHDDRYLSKSGRRRNSQSIAFDNGSSNSSNSGTAKQDDFVIPELQLLPNGQKPDFGNSSISHNNNSHNNHGYHNHNHNHIRSREKNERQGGRRRGSVMSNVELRTEYDHYNTTASDKDILKLTETLKGYLLHNNGNNSKTDGIPPDNDSVRALSAKILNPGKVRGSDKPRRNSAVVVATTEKVNRRSPKDLKNGGTNTKNETAMVSPTTNFVALNNKIVSPMSSQQTATRIPMQGLHDLSPLNSLQPLNSPQHQPVLIQPPIQMPPAVSGPINTPAPVPAPPPIMALPQFPNNCPVPVPPSMTYTPIPPQGLGYPFGLGGNINYGLNAIPGVPPQQIPLMTPIFGSNQGKSVTPIGQQIPGTVNATTTTTTTIQQEHSGSTSSSPTSSASSTSSNSSPPPPDGFSVTSPNHTSANYQVRSPRNRRRSYSGPKSQNQLNYTTTHNKNRDRRHRHNNNNNNNNNSKTDFGTSHSFAGASFAASIPEGSDLPKPSFL